MKKSGDAKHGISGVEADVLALVRPRTHSAQLDTRLSRAAAQLAAIAPEGGELGDGVVEYARQHFGIAEPDPTLLVVRGDPDARTPAMLRLRQRLSHEMLEAPAIRIGVGVAPGRGERAIAVLISRSSIALEPVPRSLPVGGSFTLEADLDGRMRDPELVVTTHDRRGVLELLGRAGRRVTAVVACGAPVGSRSSSRRRTRVADWRSRAFRFGAGWSRRLATRWRRSTSPRGSRSRLRPSAG